MFAEKIGSVAIEYEALRTNDLDAADRIVDTDFLIDRSETIQPGAYV